MHLGLNKVSLKSLFKKRKIAITLVSKNLKDRWNQEELPMLFFSNVVVVNGDGAVQI